MRRNRRWREFEQLVALIEAQAAPRGAEVKSPDRIRDLVTGRMREVDASIRLPTGSAEVLITIECRKRSRTSDDQWIEQLASKREKLGAAKTIAVSSSGFTDSAWASASKYGIDLRVLSEVNASDVNAWLSVPGAVHLFREMEDMRCEVILGEQTDQAVPLVIDPWVPVFFHNLVASPFPALVFLKFMELTQPNRFWSVPLDGTKTRLAFELDATAPGLIPVPMGDSPRMEPGTLEIKINGKRQAVRGVRVSAMISYQAAVFDREQGKHYDYRGAGERGIQHTIFEGELFGLPVRFDHQFGPDDEHSVQVRFGKHIKKDEA